MNLDDNTTSPVSAEALADLGVVATAPTSVVADAVVAANDSVADDLPEPAEPQKVPGLVTLDQPITRGARIITEVTIRKPKSGELRGLTIMGLSQLDVTQLQTLLPRITVPLLTKQEVENLDPADLMQMGGEVMDFLLPRSAKTA